MRRSLVRRATLVWAIAVAVILAGCQTPSSPIDPALAEMPSGEFIYPWADPIVATVVGTPPDLRAPLPENIPFELRRLPPEAGRSIPAVFWYQRGLRFTLNAQRGEAPLVILIAGTGAGPLARQVEVLSRIFYAGGYHVLALPSPTFSNFAVDASSTGVPGRVERDARDLYETMGQAVASVRDRIEIKNEDVSLVGYSLGAWHAAFVGHLDDRERKFGFRRVLLINPPVSLYTSSKMLDDLLVDNVPGGIDGLPVFFDEIFRTISGLYTSSAGPSDLTGDFLYKTYMQLKPSREVLAALIGLVFRLSATDLAFTADVLGHVGAIVPPERTLAISSSLTPYLIKGVRYGFTDYLTNVLYPFYRRSEPDLTVAQLVEEANLKRLGGYLAASPKYRLITNADEIINTPEEKAFLEKTFAGRETIFPRGGHCGNFQHPHVVAAMLQALREDAP